MSEHTVKPLIRQAQPLPLGAYEVQGGVRFAVDVTDSSEKTFLKIMEQGTGKKLFEICMNDYPACGNVCGIYVSGLKAGRICYQYVRNNMVIEDTYGMKLHEGNTWGSFKPVEERAVYEPWRDTFSWEDDRHPEIPYHEMILYKLHVRGFTRHPSSKVRHKGTFLGISEKAGYFRELGVNGLVLMPVVDFPEVKVRELPPSLLPHALLPSTPESQRLQNLSMLSRMSGNREPETYLNCWGYGKAQFFAPKASFAHNNCVAEFCTMVRELHKNGIEVILELLFDDRTPQGAILDCLRHWVLHYHVDGFWVNSEIVPVEMAAKDPLLAGIKWISSGMDPSRIYGKKIPVKKYLASADDSFQNTMRCFLKGDENCMSDFVYHNTSSQTQQGAVHYITTNNGFTLADLVAYDTKHNEDNGEDNKDGTDYNNSWNCGAEGKTRRRKVLALRCRQMYNAMVLLIFQQGTPMIYGGDEFGNSQQGNNNAYCQDNEIFWLNWRDLKKNCRQYEFVKGLLALRAAHPILHPEKPFRQMDYLSCGFPDLSLHGQHPWKANFDWDSRYIGIMYCGKYARRNGKEDTSFYFAYNMHWEAKEIFLPVLSKKQRWEKIMDTFYEEPWKVNDAQENQLEEETPFEEDVIIQGRSIQIYMSVDHGKKTIS